MKKAILKWLGGISEAPKDGKSYVRKNGAWVEAIIPANDNEVKQCVDKALNNVKERVAIVNQALNTKIGDAPADGKTYVRKNGNWEDLTIPEQQTINYATDEEVAEIINNAFKD